MSRAQQQRRRRGRRAAASAAKGASWLSLVAATTLGLGRVEPVRAAIRSDRDIQSDSDDYRLIVQSYSRASLARDRLPSAGARPLGSAQRAVTAEELRRGIEVSLVHLDADTREGEDRVVVAWVEPGHPDLELDALAARPVRGTYYGVGAVDGQQTSAAVRVVLRRSVD